MNTLIGGSQRRYEYHLKIRSQSEAVKQWANKTVRGMTTNGNYSNESEIGTMLMQRQRMQWMIREMLTDAKKRGEKKESVKYC